MSLVSTIVTSYIRTVKRMAFVVALMLSLSFGKLGATTFQIYDADPKLRDEMRLILDEPPTDLTGRIKRADAQLEVIRRRLLPDG